MKQYVLKSKGAKLLGLSLLLAVLVNMESDKWRNHVHLFTQPNFEKTQGEIISSSVQSIDGFRMLYTSYDVRYEYFVEGAPFISDRVSFTNDGNRYKEIIQKYPVGEKVDVFYNPKEPTMAVLDPYSKDWAGFFVTLMAIVGLFFYWKIFRLESEKPDNG